MLILSNTTDKIEVVLGATVSTNELQCVTSWRDRTSTTFVAGRNITNTNSITAVDISGSPTASTQRIIDHINIYNRDTSTADVTVKYDANGTEYILFSTPLSTGEMLEYSEGKGWVVFNSIGSQKVSLFNGVNTTSSRMAVAVLTSDVVNNNSTANTMQNVTGLSFPVEPGRYYFRFLIRYSSAATTTGSRWSVAFANGAAGAAGSLQFRSEYTLTATSRTINEGLSAEDTPAASNASSLTTNNMAVIEGYCIPTVGGTLQARFASEVSGSAITAQQGSLVFYQKTT